MSTFLEKSQRHMHINHPTANMAENKMSLQDLPDDEKEVVEELRRNYIESAKLEITLHRSIFEIEQSSDELYLDIFQKRRDILEKFRRNEEDGETSCLRGFWLRVLKAADMEFYDPHDENIMEYLIDIRSRMYVEPQVKMVIEFEFEKNDYFSNRILSKTYNIKCNAEYDEAVIYDGIEITNMEGTKIDWLIERECKPDENGHLLSFFDYFTDRPDFSNANRALLGEEIAFGFFLREKVIPKAIYFFTGEISAEKDVEFNDENDSESDSHSHSSEAEEDITDHHQNTDLDEEIYNEKEVSSGVDNEDRKSENENDVENDNEEGKAKEYEKEEERERKEDKETLLKEERVIENSTS